MKRKSSLSAVLAVLLASVLTAMPNLAAGGSSAAGPSNTPQGQKPNILFIMW